ncbi:TetR/AcrR family transcriptional regulator [Glycomyces arizonensis]|uniref:TetR/AcrR family transcriptional regulator n=1 Tax=Glycomyces arizonensis TaxID=256035 RepID=UPI001B7FC369|nr:TetR/AcrR family transcriptional regulator [Glycomyces arizonensis]
MSKTPHLADMSPAARRTRRLIIEAGIAVLAERTSATLSEIAAAADVSRSTLHRHFADRNDLLAAIDAECRARFKRAEAAARLGEGSALDSLDRLAQEYLGLGLVLGLVFADNAPVDPDSWDDEDGDGGLAVVIEGGQREGDIDPELSTEWVDVTFWTLLFGAWLSLQGGMSRRDVAFQLSRTVRKAFGAA